MDGGPGPLEGASGLVVGAPEGIDVSPEVRHGGEAGALEGFAGQDREPALDLVEPGGVRRREVKADVAVSGEPEVALGLMGTEIVEDDVDLALRLRGDDAVHEVEEFDPSAALLVGHRDLAGGDLEGGEQGAGAMASVVVRLAGERPAVTR